MRSCLIGFMLAQSLRLVAGDGTVVPLLSVEPCPNADSAVWSRAEVERFQWPFGAPSAKQLQLVGLRLRAALTDHSCARVQICPQHAQECGRRDPC